MGRPPLEAKQRQLAVALPPDLRSRLEAASAAAGHSLAEEIRARLVQSFNQDAVDEPTRKLLAAIGRFEGLIRTQSGHAWHAHAGANRTLRHMITARLQRLRPQGEATLEPADERTRLISSNDPETVGLGLEAVESNMPAEDDPRVVAAMAKMMKEMRRKLRKGDKS